MAQRMEGNKQAEQHRERISEQSPFKVEQMSRYLPWIVELLENLYDEDAIRVLFGGNKSSGKTFGLIQLLGILMNKGLRVLGIDGDIEEGGLLFDGMKRNPSYILKDLSDFTDLSLEEQQEYLASGKDPADWDGRIVAHPILYGEGDSVIPKYSQGILNPKSFAALLRLPKDKQAQELTKAVFRAEMLPEMREYMQSYLDAYVEFRDAKIKKVSANPFPKEEDEVRAREWLMIQLDNLYTKMESPTEEIRGYVGNTKKFKNKEGKTLDDYLKLLEEEHEKTLAANSVKAKALYSFLQGHLFSSPLQGDKIGEIFYLFSNHKDMQSLKSQLDSDDDYVKLREKSNMDLVNACRDHPKIKIQASVEDNELGSHRSSLGPLRLYSVATVVSSVLTDTDAIERFKIQNEYFKDKAGKEKVKFYLGRVPIEYENPNDPDMQERLNWLEIACNSVFDKDAKEGRSFISGVRVNEYSALTNELGNRPAAYFSWLEMYSLSKTLSTFEGVPVDKISIADVQQRSKQLFGRKMSTPVGPVSVQPVPAYNFDNHTNSLALTFQFDAIADAILCGIAENRYNKEEEEE